MANSRGLAGSLTNNAAHSASSPEPRIGMGATELCWTDRHAYTVVAIFSETVIAVARDRAKRVDGNDESADQDYEFETPNARDRDYYVVILKRRPNGQWVRLGEPSRGTPYYIGDRDEYCDPCF